MKKLLTEQRLCELAGLQEVGPTGTQTWNPGDDRAAREKAAEDEFFARPDAAEEERGEETAKVAAVAIPPELEIPWEELRSFGEGSAVVVDWIRSEERTPYGTQTVGVDGEAPTGVNAAGEPAQAMETPAAYKHINPHNQISHTYTGTRLGNRGRRIVPGSPWDPFPKEWTREQQDLGLALAGAVMNPEGEQEIQNLVAQMGAQREPAASVRRRHTQPGDAPRGQLSPSLKKKGLPDQGAALKRALEFEPSSRSGH